MDSFYLNNKAETNHKMTKFLIQENCNIFKNVEDALLKRFSKGRGRSHRIAPVDMLLTLLETLK